MAAPGGAVHVRDALGLAKIHLPRVSVAVLTRPDRPAMRRWAERAAKGSTFASEVVCSLEDFDAVDAFAPLLPPDDARDAFLGDVAYLAEVLLALTDARRASVRLVRSCGSHFTRWTREPASVRLVCTYAGPTCEWLEGPAWGRHAPGGRTFDGADALRGDGDVRSCEPLDVVAFKGRPFTASPAVHRVPAARRPRLVVSFQPLV